MASATPALIVEHLVFDHHAVLALEADGELALAGDHEIGGPVLIAEREGR